MITLFTGHQRCIATIRAHDEGVWALAANDTFTTIYSGGRDRKLYMIDVRNPDNRQLICEESAPILKLTLNQEQHSMWVATTNSCINNWSIKPLDNADDRDEMLDYESPLYSQPKMTIKGGTSIRQYHVLDDKRHILTKDSEGNVALWDVLTACKVEDLGKANLEEEIKKRFKMIYVPHWFTVDLRLGLLSIHLDESDCFAAWVSAKNVGMQFSDGSDPKLNFGGLLLQALLSHWPRTQPEEEPLQDGAVYNVSGSGERLSTNYCFSVPGHTPVIFSEVGGRTLFRLLAKDAGRETEAMMLNETLPLWVIDITVEKNMPKFNKIPFYLFPYPTAGIKSVKKDRLSASDMLQVRKVIEHVYEKIIGAGSDTASQAGSTHNSTSNTNTEQRSESEKEAEDLSTAAEEKVELLCQDQVLDPNMDLRTVKHFIWKSGGDLVLHYRLIK